MNYKVIICTILLLMLFISGWLAGSNYTRSKAMKEVIEQINYELIRAKMDAEVEE